MTHRCPPVLAIVGSLLSLLCCSGRTAVAAEATAADNGGLVLRYHFAPGESVSARVAHRALTETTINGTTQSVETATDSVKTWRVTGVNPDGQTIIEHLVDDVTMTSRTGGQEPTRWESDSTAPPPPGYEGVRLSLGRPLSQLTIDRCGRVLKRRDLFPNPPSNTGDLMVVPLPDEPVHVGSSWSVPEEIVVEVPGGPRKSIRTRLRYEVTAIRDQLVLIDADTTVLTPVDDPRLAARLLERIWDGHIEFDAAEGRVLSRSASVDRRVVGFHGPQSSVRYKASRDEQLLVR